MKRRTEHIINKYIKQVFEKLYNKEEVHKILEYNDNDSDRFFIHWDTSKNPVTWTNKK